MLCVSCKPGGLRHMSLSAGSSSMGLIGPYVHFIFSFFLSVLYDHVIHCDRSYLLPSSCHFVLVPLSTIQHGSNNYRALK